MNGGTCKNLGDEKYECQCTDAYIGDHCELGLYFRECILVQREMQLSSRIIYKYCIGINLLSLKCFITETVPNLQVSVIHVLDYIMATLIFTFFHLFCCGHISLSVGDFSRRTNLMYRFITWLDSIIGHCSENLTTLPFSNEEGE